MGTTELRRRFYSGAARHLHRKNVFDYHYSHVRSRRFSSIRKEIACWTYASDAHKSRLRSSSFYDRRVARKFSRIATSISGSATSNTGATCSREFASNSYSLEWSVSPPRRFEITIIHLAAGGAGTVKLQSLMAVIPSWPSLVWR